MKTLIVETINDINVVAKEFLELNKDNKVFAFYGEMGTGKTTFIKAICKQLNVISQVTSPTFSIVNEYVTDTDDKIYHFDLYRLKNLEELLDVGFEEYILSDNYIFIEWPEISEDILPENTSNIYLKTNEKNNYREISFKN